MFNRVPSVVAALLLLASSPSALRADEPSSPSPLELFEQRIMPIFKSTQPASCVQCHLAGVDLKNYILPSHEQTFASLRDQGMIDLAAPKKSKILTLIGMGDKDADKGARLIHEKTRKAEYEAFEAWITACCNDSKLRELPRLDEAKRAKPERPDEVIRHARKSRLVDSFTRNVWSQRMRCFPCHTPHELDATNPKHRAAIEKHQDFLEQEDGAFAKRMNIFQKTPEATMQYLIDKSRATAANELPLLNLKEPAKSLLVLKPTAKVPRKNDRGDFERPSYSEPVSHMGGLKMHVDDQSYKAFVAWIQDYARVVGNKYTSVADLPADNWHPSKHVVLVKEAPADWPDGARIQIFVHAWSDKDKSWVAKPIAFTQGSLTPRRTVAGMLFLFGPTGAEGQKSLTQRTPGKHLLKIYLDRNGRLTDDPTAMLGDEAYFGKVEIEARWREGFPEAEIIFGKQLK